MKQTLSVLAVIHIIATLGWAAELTRFTLKSDAIETGDRVDAVRVKRGGLIHTRQLMGRVWGQPNAGKKASATSERRPWFSSNGLRPPAQPGSN